MPVDSFPISTTFEVVDLIFDGATPTRLLAKSYTTYADLRKEAPSIICPPTLSEERMPKEQVFPNGPATPRLIMSSVSGTFILGPLASPRAKVI
jgi:hypothetical protein